MASRPPHNDSDNSQGCCAWGVNSPHMLNSLHKQTIGNRSSINPYSRTARNKQTGIDTVGIAYEFRELFSTDVSITTLGRNRRPPGLHKLRTKV